MLTTLTNHSSNTVCARISPTLRGSTMESLNLRLLHPMLRESVAIATLYHIIDFLACFENHF